MTIHAAQSRAAGADPVLFWNDQTNQAIQVTSMDPFMAPRALALESIAVFDTVNAIAGAPGFMVSLRPPNGIAPEVAVAAAAHAMLSNLFPARRAALRTVFAAQLMDWPKTPERDRAVTFGKAVANAIFALRDQDGWNAAGTVVVGTQPGQWRPTPPRYLQPLHPAWGRVQPFALRGPDQFRPAGPPAPGSASFKDAKAQTASLGAALSPIRTPEQTETARYWSDAIGTYAPAGHWNAIAASIIAPMHLSLAQEARILAAMNVAIADAAIAMADAKYTFWVWRPITAIREGGDGMAAMPDWSPLLETPNHPSYISGHSAFSGAAATVLAALVGDRPFRFGSASTPGVVRSFLGFQQAAEEAAMSRLYGGIHFAFDNVDGLATGRAVGTWTLAAFQTISDDRGPAIVLDQPMGRPVRAVAGTVVDNLWPVSAVTVSLDGGPPISTAVDDNGRFSLALPPRTGGQHDVAVTAASASGRTCTAYLAIGADAPRPAVAAR